MEALKYHYVIYATELDYYKVMFNDITHLENVEYISDPFEYYHKPKFLKKLHDFHFNDYCNYFFDIPFKSIWNKCYYQIKDNDGMPRCFIFFMDVLKHRYIPLLKYLRRENPNCKIVVYFMDIVGSRAGGLDISMIDKYFDLAVSYDPGDSKRYGFQYCPTFLSYLDVANDEKITDSDFCFIGFAKHRHCKIKEIYRNLTSMGFICDFTVLCPPPSDSLQNGIKYSEKMMSYRQYIQHIKKTKCIIELQQENASGYTLRTWESLLYGKYLLTDNTAIKNAPFFDEKRFFILEGNYWSHFREAFLNIIDLGKDYRGELSCLNFIKLLENSL